MLPTAGAHHSPAVFDSRPMQGGNLRFYWCAQDGLYRKNMKINPNALDADELETQNFIKIGSKKHKLKGRQTVTQLIAAAKRP